MKVNIHVWSAPLKPLRKFSVSFDVQRKIVEIIPWLEKLFKLPVHTFVTISEDWNEPPGENSKQGYWYCAGDFCSTNDSTVFGFEIDNTDIDFACCLVKPDINLEDPAHEQEVIGGSYLVDFVCHNIANRVLFASNDSSTLINTSVPLTGYKAIVNSPLGVYGRNKREWALIIDKCSRITSDPNDPNQNKNKPQRTKEEELELIHLRAAKGNIKISKKISDALYEVDENYADSSEDIYQDLESGKIEIEELNKRMEKLLRKTITETQRIVGKPLAKEIYGDYSIEEDPSSNSEGGTGSSEDKDKENIVIQYQYAG